MKKCNKIMRQCLMILCCILMQIDVLMAQCSVSVEATSNTICRGASVALSAEISGTNINNCGQSVSMSNLTTVVDCGVGLCFYDAGGPSGSYSNSTSYTQVFTSNNGSPITIHFVTVSLESSFDELYIYEGVNTNGNLLNSGNLYGGLAGMTYTSNTGSITVQFTPDGSVTYAGWAAIISCNACSNYTYQWSNGATGNTTNVSPNTTTTYTVTVTSANCCTATGAVTINVANCESGTACPTVDISNDINGDEDVISVTCHNSCVNLSADVIATAPYSEHYTVSSIPYNPPFGYMSGTRIFANASDDTWGAALPLPFGFCYYGTTYHAITPGSNAVATFNSVSQGSGCTWSFSASIPSPSLITNAIFAAYRDILPTSSYYNSITGDCAIYQGIIGNYPCRSYVLSYYNVTLFSCTSSRTFTTMIVLYEGTNVIDIYIRSAPTCSSWNNGNGLIGIQNATGTEGVTPPNRNTGPWTASNEAWRFTPIGDPIVTLTWYEGEGINGAVLGTSNNIEVCPTENTSYTLRMQYTACNGDAFDLTSSVQVVLDNAIGDVHIDATDTLLCGNESTTLTLVSDATVTSYLWSSGQTTQTINVTPSASTTYTCTITTENGCTGTASIHITVSPDPAVSISASDSSLCLGESTTLTATANDAATYLWSTGESTASITVTPTTNTTYSCTVTGSAGCVGQASLLITATPLPFVSITATSQQLCEGESTTLTASAPQGSTYLWNTGANTAAITVTPSTSTTYTCTVTNGNNCTGTASIDITVSINPIVGISASDSSLCLGETATLTATANVNGTYLWSTGESTASITVSPTVNTTYTCTVTGPTGCVGQASLLIVATPLPFVTITATPQQLCEGESTTLTASAPQANTYLWNTGDNTPSLIVTPLTTTTYSCTITNTNGCSGSHTIIVTVNTIPQLQVSATIDTVCIGATTTITASGADTYQWSNGQTTPSITCGAGTYSVTGTHINCVSDTTITIFEYPAMQLSLTPIASTCESANGIIYATVMGTTAPYDYVWNNGAVGDTLDQVSAGTYSVTVTDRGGCTISMTGVISDINPIVSLENITQSHCGQSDAMASVVVTGGTGVYTYDWHLTPNITEAVANGLAAGTYIVTVSDGNCTIDFPITITEAPVPTACFTISPSVAMAGETVVQYHNCSTNATSWFWDFGDGDESSVSFPTHVYQNTGFYNVVLVVSDAYNCTASTQLEIEVVDGTTFYIPTAFTPDGDGLNETIKPVITNCLPDSYEFIIFDRWGKMVFRTTEIEQGWDGIYNGTKIEIMTTFVYTIQYSDIMGTPHNKIGHFILLP